MNACVIEGRPMVNGYSRINVEGERLYAHRHAWEQANGPIPAGMQIHHLCGNRVCVNVAHLALVTPKAHNSLHGPERRKCDHERVVEGTKTRCRICKNARRRERYRTDSEHREQILATNRRWWNARVVRTSV